MSQVMFYTKPEPINKEKHRDLRLDVTKVDLSFASQTNSVMLAGMEFQHAAKEYPIVFVQGAQEQIFAAALLGVRTNENLFIDTTGRWDANYIPAFVRRYPFILAKTENDSEKLTVCMDTAFSAFNTTQGERLFDDQGEATVMMNNMIKFLQECQEGFQRTEVFINRLKAMDLLVTLTANIETKSGSKFALQGLMTVDEKKLLALDQTKAMELFKLGELGWIYSHLISLSNVNRLANSMAKRELSAAALTKE